MPTLDDDLLLVFATDKSNEIARGCRGYDVVVFCGNVEKRHADFTDINRFVTHVKVAVDDLVATEKIADKFLGEQAGERQLIRGPAVET